MNATLNWDWRRRSIHQQLILDIKIYREATLVVGDISTNGTAVVQIGVDAGVKLVGKVRVVRASSLPSVSRAWGVVAAAAKGTAAAELLVTSSVVPVRVNSRVQLVGNVGTMWAVVARARTIVVGRAVGVRRSIAGASTRRSIATGRTTVVKVAIDTRVCFVGKVGVVRAIVGRTTSIGVGRTAITTSSAVVPVAVYARVELVRSVGVVRTIVGRSASIGVRAISV